MALNHSSKSLSPREADLGQAAGEGAPTPGNGGWMSARALQGLLVSKLVTLRGPAPGESELALWQQSLVGREKGVMMADGLGAHLGLPCFPRE